jgi:serine/threonine-protein kinase RsbW
MFWHSLPACSVPAWCEIDVEATRPKSLEIRIPADTRYLSVVRRGVRSLAESAGFAREDVADLEVAVSEAVTNSVEHGNPDLEDGGVLVKCETTGDYMIVEVEDHSAAESIPLDPETCDATKERGRGILMMRALMDECCNTRTEHGMRVRMAKAKAR